MKSTKQNEFFGAISFLLCLYILWGFNVKPSMTQQGVKKMVCYFAGGYRFNFSGDSIDPFLCTHIIMTGGIVSPDGIKLNNYSVDMKQLKAIASLKKKNPSLIVMLSLQQGFQSVVNQTTGVISRFAMYAVLFLEKLNLDGLDLDWEYPQSFEKSNYAVFIEILSSYLHTSNLLLSLAFPAYPSLIFTGYNIDIINKYVDFVTVMTYDYNHYVKDVNNVTGYNSPLYTPEGENLYHSTAASITYVLSRGLSKDKILMGIPTYGRSWILANPDDHGLHSPAVGEGGPAPYNHIRGTYTYPDVCVALRQGAVIGEDAENVGEYLYNGTTWVAFEGSFTIKKKIQWLYKRALAGIGIWAYQLDDIYDVCGQGRTPLLQLMKDELQYHNILYFSPEH